MSKLIIAFPRRENGSKIRDICVRSGFDVDGVCTTGAAVLEMANSLDSGIVISAARLPDMFFTELTEQLPDTFRMLLLASAETLSSVEEKGVVSLSMPLSVGDLVSTLNMMRRQLNYQKKKKPFKPRPRSPEEQKTIDTAKHILMERNHMTEAEAHRYIQKTSMDNGTAFLETAEMILTLMQ